jgi:hypothetical protein
MTSPVLQALVNARVRSINVKDDAMASLVAEILGPSPKESRPEPQMFRLWCESKAVTSLPAATSAVALFVIEKAGLGVENVLQHIRDISASHRNAGLADPTTDWAVTAAFNKISKVEPPRSWNAEGRALFLGLPYPVQKFIVGREAERDTAVRRAQNEAAELRKKFNDQTPKEAHEGPVQVANA